MHPPYPLATHCPRVVAAYQTSAQLQLLQWNAMKSASLYIQLLYCDSQTHTIPCCCLSRLSCQAAAPPPTHTHASAGTSPTHTGPAWGSTHNRSRGAHEQSPWLGFFWPWRAAEQHAATLGLLGCARRRPSVGADCTGGMCWNSQAKCSWRVSKRQSGPQLIQHQVVTEATAVHTMAV